MGDAILVINAGSSSIKFVVFVADTARPLAAADADPQLGRIGDEPFH